MTTESKRIYRIVLSVAEHYDSLCMDNAPERETLARAVAAALDEHAAPALPTVNARDVFKWNPCWSPVSIEAVLVQYEDEPWNALDVLNPELIPEVSPVDRLWLAVRPELVPIPVAVKWARECADAVAYAAVTYAAVAARDTRARQCARLRQLLMDYQNGNGA